MWTPYKNGQGAKRTDGLYLRRAWNWFPIGVRPFQKRKGWDLMRGLTLLGTFPDQPVVDVQSKVDLEVPLGDGRLSPWKYTPIKCSHCEATSFVQSLPWGYIYTVKCPWCQRESNIRAFRDPVREVELLPEQRIAQVTATSDR